MTVRKEGRSAWTAGRFRLALAAILLGVCLSVKLWGDEAESFHRRQASQIAEMRRAQAVAIDLQQDHMARANGRSRQAFSAWRLEQQRRFAAFEAAVSRKWGLFLRPERTRWVEYGRDTTSVFTVDFSSGTTTAAILADTAAAHADVARQLTRTIVAALTSRGSRGGLPLADAAAAPAGRPVLDGQVQTAAGAPVTPANAQEFAAELLDSLGLEVLYPGPDSGRAVVSVQFGLVPDHLRRRMEPYLPLVRQSAERFGLSEAHVLATIHTESCFNPLAVSPANAIGLMQLVPETGGAEAYRLVTGSEGIPSQEYLFDPANNITLGCAYIHLLTRRYFAPVNDSLSRLYCTIAGYNGGPAGVATAFVGRPLLRQALTAINACGDAEGVYRSMLAGLPLAETRQYLATVRTRMGLYR